MIVGAFTLPWANRTEVFVRTGVPLLLFVGCSLGAYLGGLYTSQFVSWVFVGLYLAALCWLAIIVHRMVLLEEPVAPMRFDAQWLRRFAKFLVASIAIWVIYQGTRLLLFSGVLAMIGSRYVPAGEVPPTQPLPVSLATLDNIVSVLTWVLLGRLSMIFPAIAIDQRFDVVDIWRLSRGNGWRLAIVAGLLPTLLHLFTGLLYRDGGTSVETTLILVLAGIFVIVEVVALSLSYRELTAPEPPPSDPPA